MESGNKNICCFLPLTKLLAQLSHTFHLFNSKRKSFKSQLNFYSAKLRRSVKIAPKAIRSVVFTLLLNYILQYHGSLTLLKQGKSHLYTLQFVPLPQQAPGEVAPYAHSQRR